MFYNWIRSVIIQLGHIITWFRVTWYCMKQDSNSDIAGLVQERCNSSALAMELRLSCINPSIWCISKADSRFAPSQWETALLCNNISHWLGASLESALYIKPGAHNRQPIAYLYSCASYGLSFVSILQKIDHVWWCNVTRLFEMTM